MGRLGKQPQGEVLRNHEGRPAPACPGSGQLVADRRHHVAFASETGIGGSMYRLRSFIVRLVNLFRRSRLESDLKEQFEAHREMIQSDLISRGMNAADAAATARRAMGNESLVR